MVALFGVFICNPNYYWTRSKPKAMQEMLKTKLNIRLLNIIMFCYCCTLAPSCNHSHLSESLQEGDLLFQDLNCGDLCNAIEVFTEGVNGKYFSVQWWVKINDTLKVVEAIGDKVQVNSLNNFFERSGDTSTIKNVTIARVKHNYKPLITKATAFAKQQRGQPYDNDFLLENGKWYSIELLYQSLG
jgi:hypothetical protein